MRAPTKPLVVTQRREQRRWAIPLAGLLVIVVLAKARGAPDEESRLFRVYTGRIRESFGRAFSSIALE